MVSQQLTENELLKLNVQTVLHVKTKTERMHHQKYQRKILYIINSILTSAVTNGESFIGICWKPYFSYNPIAAFN
jgi:glutamine amidotransferase-like uncharacterized protein